MEEQKLDGARDPKDRGGAMGYEDPGEAEEMRSQGDITSLEDGGGADGSRD